MPVGTRDLTIMNERGLHARAAAKFVGIAIGFEAEITVSMAGNAVSGTSIMGLMMLAATTGSTIRIRAKGADASGAINARSQLVSNGFDED